MKPSSLLAALILSGCANTTPVATSLHLEGKYQFLGDGDLCFIPSPDFERQFPHWEPGSKLCFSNTDFAIDSIGAGEALSKVGYSHIWGFEGNATVTVTDILASDGRDDWLYQAKLVHAESVQPYNLIRCDG